MSGRPWWRSASVYQLYVRSFADSNGDGIGDLRGIHDRIGHIARLGVDAIWLNPCYPSPQLDHGYDVSDFFDIEPAYGDLAAIDGLIAAAHEHGIRVLMDVVPNHCSWEHPMFTAAVAAGPGSAARDRFYFRPGRGPDGSLPPNNWTAIFGGSTWTRVTEPDGSPGEWYLGVFSPAQPDFNWENDDVAEHFDRVLRFWFDRGADGFRADAVIHLGKADGLPDFDHVPGETWEINPHFTWIPEAHGVWRRWRALVDAYEREHPGRELLLVAEASAPGRPDVMAEYANALEFHQAFAFDLMLAPWRPAMLREVIDGVMGALAEHGQLPAWTLNNHDAERSTTRYGRADVDECDELAPAAINGSRAPVDQALGDRRARAAALLELALPGAVYLYAGEELGLPEVLDLPDEARQDPVFRNTDGRQYGRDGCRIPLPWTVAADASFGFSTRSTAAAPWLPQPADWGRLSVEAQESDPSSVLWMYRRAGELRQHHPAFRSDDFAWADGCPDDVVAFRRGDVLVVLNPNPTARVLDRAVVGERTVLLSSLHAHVDPTVVPPDSTLWLQ